MKKITKIVAVLLLCAIMIIPLSACSAKDEILFKVYNAADYIDETVINKFIEHYKEKTGKTIKVQYDNFDTLERAYTIINQRKADYDVVCPSDYTIIKMKNNDLLNPINLDNVPNVKNIPSYLLDRGFDKGNQYSVPYMWGTLGILYNADKVSENDLKGWDLLWNSKYKGKILMKDSIRDSVFIATIYAYKEELKTYRASHTIAEYNAYLDKLVNTVNETQLQRVEAVLKEQYKLLYGYEVDSGKDAMVNGEAWLNLAWSGDAVWAIEEAAKNNINLNYYIPEEGSNIWFDNWVIPKYGKHQDIAEEFINFLCDPEIAMLNTDYIGYTTAVFNEELLNYYSENEGDSNIEYLFKTNPFDPNSGIEPAWKDVVANINANGIDLKHTTVHEVIYPSLEKVYSCVEMSDFGEKQDDIVKMWTRVKSTPLGPEVIIFNVLLGVFVVTLLGVTIYKKIKAKSSRN